MTARAKAAGTPRTMSARMERQIRELLVEQMSQGDTFAALMNMLSLEVDAERALSAELAEACERALAFVESMPDADNVELTPALRAALAKARGERGGN